MTAKRPTPPRECPHCKQAMWDFQSVCYICGTRINESTSQRVNSLQRITLAAIVLFLVVVMCDVACAQVCTGAGCVVPFQPARVRPLAPVARPPNSKPPLVVWYDTRADDYRQLYADILCRPELLDEIRARFDVHYRTWAGGGVVLRTSTGQLRGYTTLNAALTFLGLETKQEPQEPPAVAEDTDDPEVPPRQSPAGCSCQSSIDIEQRVDAQIATRITEIKATVNNWNDALGEWRPMIDAQAQRIEQVEADLNELAHVVSEVQQQQTSISAKVDELYLIVSGAAPSDLGDVEARLSALERPKRVIVLDGQQGVVLADETYTPEEPIVLDVNRLFKTRNPK